MENLYLVTRHAERHEDHIPIGVFTFAELKKRFPSFEKQNEKDFDPGEWTSLFAIDLEEYKFSKEEIDEVIASKENWYDFIAQNEACCYAFNVIRILVNAEMDYT